MGGISNPMGTAAGNTKSTRVLPASTDSRRNSSPSGCGPLLWVRSTTA
jgi:hypothetical protein